MPWLRAVVVFGFLGTLVWAGDEDVVRREIIVKNMLRNMGSITKILDRLQADTIQKEDTLKSAQVDLKKAADVWMALRKQAESMPPPSKMEADRLAGLYKARLEDAQRSLFAQIVRVQRLPGGRDLLGDLAKAFAPAPKKMLLLDQTLERV